MFERKGIYYLTYPHAVTVDGREAEQLEYAIGKSPLGPFTVTGLMMDQTPNGCWTNHQSLVEYQGQWILFYHDRDLSPEFDKNRSVRADYITFNDDGTMNKADGKGLWWDGLDPQDLYAQYHAIGGRGRGGAGGGMAKGYSEKYFYRIVDLIDKYDPDILYFDDSVFPLYPATDVGPRIAAYLYNRSVERHGKLEAVMTGKGLNAAQRKAILLDIERGVTGGGDPIPWQTDTCIGDWHYNRSVFDRHRYKTPIQVVQMLVDIGALTADQAKTSPRKNVILQAIGPQPTLTAAIVRLLLRRGDRLLVCCDGLSNELDEAELAKILAEPDPSAASGHAIAAANAHGGNDNITAIIAHVGGEGIPTAAIGERITATYRVVQEPHKR